MSLSAADLNAESITSRAAINAANAQFSTGARTPEGKERIRFNALKTGIFAKTIVLPTEEQADYDDLGEQLHSAWLPRTDAERDLVLTVQATTWRLRRVIQLDFSIHALGTHRHLEAIALEFPDRNPEFQYAMAQAAGHVANSRVLDQLSKQEGRLNRILTSANRELETLAGLRIHSVETPAPAPVAPTIPSPVAPATNPLGGFVPSKYPRNMPAFSGPQAKEHRRLWLRKNAQKNMA